MQCEFSATRHTQVYVEMLSPWLAINPTLRSFLSHTVGLLCAYASRLLLLLSMLYAKRPLLLSKNTFLGWRRECF